MTSASRQSARFHALHTERERAMCVDVSGRKDITCRTLSGESVKRDEEELFMIAGERRAEGRRKEEEGGGKFGKWMEVIFFSHFFFKNLNFHSLNEST